MTLSTTTTSHAHVYDEAFDALHVESTTSKSERMHLHSRTDGAPKPVKVRELI
jgi:hypothetical protein